MVKVLIVEDEFTIALDLEERLKKMKFEIVGIAHNYDTALSLLLENEPDISLLDINLGEGKSGIDLAKIINSKFNIPIIFLSAYSDDITFNEAQQANPMGFIVKPFKDVDINHAIKIALQRFKDIKQISDISKNIKTEIDENFVFIKDKGKITKINKDNILWLEAMDNYTIIHTHSGKHIASSSLKSVIKKLNSSNFFRIHKSHAVALNKISKIEDNLIYINKTYLVISRTYKKDLMEKINLL